MSALIHKALLLAGLIVSTSITVSAVPVDPTGTITPSYIETRNETDADLTRRNIITALFARATTMEFDYQPFMDFDKDGCYYTAAIDSNGNKNPGLPPALVGYPECLSHTCRDKNRLQNNNVYSRLHCIGEWCAIMYEFYFERDYYDCGVGTAQGHVHDWENVVVFVQNGVVRQVAVSRHGGYDSQQVSSGKVRMSGKRAKVVYHKDGISTHAFRFAKEADEAIENYWGAWYLGNLVGWGGWPSVAVRDRGMNGWNENAAHPKLTDSKFPRYIRLAANGKVPPFNNWDGPL